MLTPTDGWATGTLFTTTRTTYDYIVLHYDGTRWQSFNTEHVNAQNAIFATGPDAAWEFARTIPAGGVHPVQWQGNHSHEMALPGVTDQFIAFNQDAQGDLWLATTMQASSAHIVDALFRYHNGVWTVFAQG